MYAAASTSTSLQPLQHLDQVSKNTHGGDIRAGTAVASVNQSRSRQYKHKEKLPSALDDERISTVSLSVEADDVVASFKSRDRTSLIEPA
jgi:ACT domain-containing protein